MASIGQLTLTNPSSKCSPNLHQLQHGLVHGAAPSIHFTVDGRARIRQSIRSCAGPDTTSSPSPSSPPLDLKTPPPSLPQESQSSSSSSFYTTMKGNNLGYWDIYKGLEKADDSTTKGWLNEQGQEDPFLTAHLLLIANLALDRAQMHDTIGKQRDNWNKLFQSSLMTIMMTSTVLAALDACSPGLAFSLPAFVMDAISACMMVGINRFQPSQLAEEQRTARRLCQKLSNDIELMLRIAPQLRQDAQAFLAEAEGRLLAIDRAYPLPLTPVVVEKFPEEVEAPVVSGRADMAAPEVHAAGNGWDAGMSQNLREVGDLMHEADAEAYKRLARRVEAINKTCAVGAPLCAMVGALMNGYDGLWGHEGVNLALWAAMASTVAAFASSFSHDAQLGMIFELYRSSIGFFAETEASIHRMVRLPVEKRENGQLFTYRVAYELGRKPQDLPLVPSTQKTAASLF